MWRLLLGLVFLILAVIGASGNAWAQDRNKADPPPVERMVSIGVGEKSTLIVFTTTTLRSFPGAADYVAAGVPGAFVCDALRGVQIAGREACYWTGWDPAIRKSAQSEVTVEGEHLRIVTRSRVSTDRLLDPLGALTLTIPTPETTLSVIAVAGPPYLLAAAEPLPSQLTGRRAVFRSSDMRRGGTDKISLQFDFEPGARALTSPRLAPLSVTEQAPKEIRSWLSLDFGPLVGETGQAIVWLLPILLAASVIRSRPGLPQVELGVARRLLLPLGLLCLVGSFARTNNIYSLLGGEALGFLWRTAYAAVGVSGPGEGWRSALASGGIDWLIHVGGMLIQLMLLAAGLLLLGWTVRRSGWRRRFPYFRILLLGAGFTAGTLLLVRLAKSAEVGLLPEDLPYEFYAAVTLLPLIALVMLVVGRIGLLLEVRRRAALYAVSALVSAALLFPWQPGVFSTSARFRPGGEAVAPPLLDATGSQLAPLASLSVIFLLISYFKSRPGPAFASSPHPVAFAGAIAFCVPLSSLAGASWWGVAAMLAAIFIIWPRYVLAPRDLVHLRDRSRSAVEGSLAHWVDLLERMASLKAAARASALNMKLSSGELSPAEWTKKRTALEAARDAAIDAVHLPNDVPARDLILGLSPNLDPWTSGVATVTRAIPIAVLLTGLNLTRLPDTSSALQPALLWLGTIARPAGGMLVVAFLFGYFFDRIQGGTGLNKALRLASGLGVAELLLWLPHFGRSNAFPGLLWAISQHFLLLIPLGVIGFDYARMRSIEGMKFDWRRFNWFGDPRLLSTGAAATAAALVPLVATAFSESFAKGVEDVFTAVAPVLAVT